MSKTCLKKSEIILFPYLELSFMFLTLETEINTKPLIHTNMKTQTNQTKFFKNVTVNEDRKYSRSYGSAHDVEYGYATLDGKWLTPYSSVGFAMSKKNIEAKHFHSFEGKEIKEATFKKEMRKRANAWETEKKEAELNRRAEIVVYKLRMEEVTQLLNPFMDEMKEEGIRLVSGCNPSRGAAWYTWNKMNLSNLGVTVQEVRDWMRNEETIKLYYA